MSNSELPTLNIDHVYILVSQDAPEAQYLQDIGLFLIDSVAYHEGQGTAARFFMFQNMYLELVWIHDRDELKNSEAAAGIRTFAPDNWSEIGASPFGVGLHAINGDWVELPVLTVQNRGPWMSEKDRIDMIPQPNLNEPSYFVLSGRIAYTHAYDGETDHPLGLKHLTKLRITVTPGKPLTKMSQMLVTQGVLEITYGPAPLMEMTFDHGIQGKRFDCRPVLPLIISC